VTNLQDTSPGRFWFHARISMGGIAESKLPCTAGIVLGILTVNAHNLP